MTPLPLAFLLMASILLGACGRKPDVSVWMHDQGQEIDYRGIRVDVKNK
jgi:hypothetical protein